MITVLEQRFMERMPSILIDLVKQVETLNKQVEELNKKLESKPSVDWGKMDFRSPYNSQVDH